MNSIFFLILLTITLPLVIVFGFKSRITPQSFDNNDILRANKTSVQLRIFPGSSIKLFSQYEKSHNLSYKVFSQNVITKQRSMKMVHYSRLKPDHPFYQLQPDSGIIYNSNEFVSFWANTTDVSNMAFVIEIVILDSLTNDNRNNKLIGYIRPFETSETNGKRNVSLLDDNLNIRGEIQIDYLVIRPITYFDPTAKRSISIDGIHFTGHRGTGIGIRKDLPEGFIENTISAFNYVCSKGAQMIELDVQLSSDRIPIIYHDFEIKTFIINRHNNKKKETIKIPVKDVSYAIMQQISTNFMPHTPNNATKHDQSFETLEDVLKDLTPNCGIDVEIKYPSQKTNLKYETELGIELNEYVDRILEVLFKYGGDRPMFITSFQPDLCSMIKLKQNKYGVGFLTTGKEWTRDPRSNSIELGTAFAQSMFFKGIVPIVDVVLTPTPRQYHYINYIKNRNLGLYLWGNKINNYELVKDLIKNGVDMVIFDHLDKIIPQKHYTKKLNISKKYNEYET